MDIVLKKQLKLKYCVEFENNDSERVHCQSNNQDHCKIKFYKSVDHFSINFQPKKYAKIGKNEFLNISNLVQKNMFLLVCDWNLYHTFILHILLLLLIFSSVLAVKQCLYCLEVKALNKFI